MWTELNIFFCLIDRDLNAIATADQSWDLSPCSAAYGQASVAAGMSNKNNFISSIHPATDPAVTENYKWVHLWCIIGNGHATPWGSAVRCKCDACRRIPALRHFLLKPTSPSAISLAKCATAGQTVKLPCVKLMNTVFRLLTNYRHDSLISTCFCDGEVESIKFEFL